MYCDVEIGVRGHSRSSKAVLFDRTHTTLYSSSVVNMPVMVCNSVMVENRYPFVFGAPVRDEAVRFKQQPLVTKN